MRTRLDFAVSRLALSLALSVPSIAFAQGPVPVEAPPRVFSRAEAHYSYLLEQADGGTRHSPETLPDWSGIWLGVPSNSSLRHPVDAPLSPAYRAGYEELLRQMQDDGEIDYDRLTHCEPMGFPRWLFIGSKEFVFTSGQAWLMQDYMNETRRVYTDGRGHHTPEGNTWLGDSIGFWDDDKLVIWTLGVKAADYNRGYPRTSARLQGIEVWQLVEGEDDEADRLVTQITIYDPEGLTAPWNLSMAHDRSAVEYRIRYWECATTNFSAQDDDGTTIMTTLPGEALDAE